MDAYILRRVLAARDARYQLKSYWSKTNYTLIEIATIMPGYPKHTKGLSQLFLDGVSTIHHQLDGKPQIAIFDDAGYYAVLLSNKDLEKSKKKAIEIEESTPWNRLLDIDCEHEKKRLTRKLLGLKERSCLVCGLPHNICLHTKQHSINTCRIYALDLVKQYINNTRLNSALQTQISI